MKISIVVPVYNVENYLDACLSSIEQQTHRDLEIILVDDASTDSSAAIAEGFANRCPQARLVRHARNRGLSAARNTGIDHASGDLVAFIDSDDVVAPHFAETMVALREVSRAPIVSVEMITFDDGETPLFAARSLLPRYRSLQPGDPDRFRPPYFAWLKAIDRDFLQASGIRFREGELYEDHRFHWLLAASEAPMASVDRALYGYRLREGSITADAARGRARLAILRELTETIGAEQGRAVAEIGEEGIVEGLAYLMAVTKAADRSDLFAFAEGEVAAIAARSPDFRPRTPRQRFVWHGLRSGPAGRTVLRIALALRDRLGKAGAR